MSVASWRFLWQSLVPWAYGALGACAFLLRSAHYFIHQRTSTPGARRNIQPHPARRDLGRRDHPVHRIPDQRRRRIGRASRAAALGFVAGYSGDLLFNLVERVVTAIFPKVSTETFRPTTPRKRLLRKIRRLRAG